MRLSLLVVVPLALAACRALPGEPPAEVSIRVSGFTAAEGIT